MKKKDPVKKNMDKLHKPRTHKDKTKYKRKEKKISKIDLGQQESLYIYFLSFANLIDQ